MLRIIFEYQWIRKGDSWILLDGMGRAVGMILIVNEADEYPVFERVNIDGRVTV